MIGYAYCWTCRREHPADLDLLICCKCGKNPHKDPRTEPKPATPPPPPDTTPGFL